MKIISRKIHAFLDYAVATILLIVSLLVFNENEKAAYTLLTAGCLTIIYSLLTSYEYGVIKLLSFDAHLSVDTASGIFLAFSPWLLGFYEDVYLPHLIFGLAELLVVSLTIRDSINHKRSHFIKIK